MRLKIKLYILRKDRKKQKTTMMKCISSNEKIRPRRERRKIGGNKWFKRKWRVKEEWEENAGGGRRGLRVRRKNKGKI